MTPFEKRMIEDMKLVGYSKRTQDTYIYTVRKLTEYFQKSPDQITNEELRSYLLWHKETYAPNTTTIALCGIKFFYQKILKKPMPVFDLARQPRCRKLPVVLTREEVRGVLNNIRVLRHRACLTLIYSAGLRISEAVTMRVSQIDSKRMVVHVRAGKGLRDRYVPLPQATLQLLLAANQAVPICRLLPYYRLPETGNYPVWWSVFLNHILLAAGWLTTHPEKQEISPHLNCK